MVAIPEQPQLTFEQKKEQLQAWYLLKQSLTNIRNQEMPLRKYIAKIFVPEPVEGTNRADLQDGFDLILKHNFTRSVDAAALDASTTELRKAKVKVDELFEYKPTLVLSAYRTLTEEQRLLVDAVLVIDEGAPSIEIGPHKIEAAEPAQVSLPAPPAAAPTYALGPKAESFTLQDFYDQGWTNEMLIQEGYLIPQEPEGKPEPKRRGRAKGSKNKPK